MKNKYTIEFKGNLDLLKEIQLNKKSIYFKDKTELNKNNNILIEIELEENSFLDEIFKEDDFNNKFEIKENKTENNDYFDDIEINLNDLEKEIEWLYIEENYIGNKKIENSFENLLFLEEKDNYFDLNLELEKLREKELEKEYKKSRKDIEEDLNKEIYKLEKILSKIEESEKLENFLNSLKNKKTQ